MNADLDRPSASLIIKVMKNVADRWIPVSAALTAFGSLMTFCVLFTYLHAIGHPKLLGLALGAATALIPWIVIAALMFALCLAGLTATSAVYGSALALFNRKPDVQRYMALMLILPACAGITAMVACIILGHRVGAFRTVSIAGVSVAIAMLLMLLIASFRAAMANAVVWEAHSTRKAKLLAIIRCATVTFAVWGTAMAATAPMLILINTYTWPSDQYGLYKLVGVCILVSGLGLLPTAAYYIWRDSPWERTRNTAVGVIIVVAAALIFAPATAPIIVDRAASTIGIKDTRVSSYMIKDTYAAEDFDSQWAEVETLRGHPVVRGFALFTLGDVLLLCPGSLATTDFDDWPLVSHACLALDAKTTKQMPEKLKTTGKVVR